MNSESNYRENINSLIDEYSAIKYAEKEFVPGISFVPVSGKVIDAEEIKLMTAACMDGWLTTGRFNKEFEKKLSDFIGVKHLLTVNSGSSANLVAFSTLTSPKLGHKAIKPGDEIVCVAAGFPTTVNPIVQYQAVPVFVDIDIPSYNIDAEKVENAISDKTKAIMIAHTLGNPFNLKVIKDICEKYDLWLIEDCCDALGSTYNQKKVGTFGDIGTLSFYPAHHVTMGEGGAVFTNSVKLKRIAESFRDWGRDCFCEPGMDNTCKKRFEWQLGELPFGYDHKYIYSHLGFNLKITDMQAACGLAQLNKLDSFIEARKANFNYLYQGLSHLKDILMLPEATPNSIPSWFGFPITIQEEAKFSRVELLRFLDAKLIGSRLLFAGNIIKQPYFKDINYRISSSLTNTDFVMDNTFWIGLYPGLTKQHLDYTIEVISEFVKKK